MKKFFRSLFFIILLIICIGIFLTVNKGYTMYKTAIDKTSIKDKVLEIKEKENYTKISELPKIYIDAVLAVEDHRFYNHKGIDLIAIGRAIINDIKEKDLVEGGSTITQQLAKNAYFTQEKTIERKIAEVFMAFTIEKECDKDEILELYLNTSYFGSGYYTVKEAAKGYFGKEPINMTESESIMLAGIPNAPSVYNPNINPKLAKQRQKQVIDKMIRNGFLTEQKANNILN